MTDAASESQRGGRSRALHAANARRLIGAKPSRAGEPLDSVSPAAESVPLNTQNVRVAATQRGKELLMSCLIAEAASHLRLALLQALPTDDQIILDHIREALRLLEGAGAEAA